MVIRITREWVINLLPLMSNRRSRGEESKKSGNKILEFFISKSVVVEVENVNFTFISFLDLHFSILPIH